MNCRPRFREQPEPQVIYKYVEKDTGKPIDEPVPAATPPQAAPVAASAQPPAETAMTALPAAPAGGVIDPNDESYWAGVIKEKSALEIQVDDLNRKLTQSMIDVEELKKANSDLEIEPGTT